MFDIFYQSKSKYTLVLMKELCELFFRLIQMRFSECSDPNM